MKHDESRGDAAHLDQPSENALKGARVSLCHVASLEARRGTENEAEALARIVATDELIRCKNPCDEITDYVGDDQSRRIQTLSETPAENPHDLACKLATLYHQMVHAAAQDYWGPRQSLALLGSALADAVLLNAGPLNLPAECKLPIKGTADVEYWRVRADEMDARR